MYKTQLMLFTWKKVSVILSLDPLLIVFFSTIKKTFSTREKEQLQSDGLNYKLFIYFKNLQKIFLFSNSKNKHEFSCFWRKFNYSSEIRFKLKLFNNRSGRVSFIKLPKVQRDNFNVSTICRDNFYLFNSPPLSCALMRTQ